LRDVFIDRLSGLAEENDDVFLITGDLGFGVLEDFSSRFPDQFLNVGVAEQNMTGIATGLALEGYKVFTYSIANFTTLRCLEQIRNDACYHDANVNVVSIGGGFGYGPLGMSHHATEDLSIMRALPNIKVVVPGDDSESAAATEALYNDNGPSYLRLERGPVNLGEFQSTNFELGKSNTLLEGKDLTIISSGGITEVAINVAKKLKNKGISLGVVSMHTLKPIDEEVIIKSIDNSGGIITLEENNLMGGLGSAVAEVCLDKGYYPKKFKRIGMKDKYSSVVGSQEYLRNYYEMDEIALELAVMELL